MLASLDIFLLAKDGELMWKGTAESFDIAKLSVQELMASTPGDYVIYSQRTGNKTIIKADGSVIVSTDTSVTL